MLSEAVLLFAVGLNGARAQDRKPGKGEPAAALYPHCPHAKTRTSAW